MTYVLIMLLAGGLIAFQSPINALLGRTIGVLESGLFNFLVGTVFLLIVTFLAGHGQLTRFTATPPWQWIGGILGSIVVLSTIICVPRIGALTTLLAMICGNLLVGAIIDHFGFFGLQIIPFTFLRAAGFCAIGLGLWLILQH